MRFGTLFAVAPVTIIGAAWIAFGNWERDLALDPPVADLPVFELVRDRPAVITRGAAILVTADRARDELTAYLRFDYLRQRLRVAKAGISPDAVLLSVSERAGRPVYEVQIALQPDLLRAIPKVYALQTSRIVKQPGICEVSERVLEYWRKQTDLFVAAYNFPVRRRMETLPPARIVSPLARYVRFRAETDPRVRNAMAPVPAVPSNEAARMLATDIVAVAGFYSLPLDLFLGIGAIENNYMNVTGDVQHTAWKKRAEPGDIVIARRRGRVLVRNFSIGIWQITRETLRRAHRLYLDDDRDYSALPERLRPPEVLDVDNVDPHVLTTYAGLYLRDLLDKFSGDERQAAGAYNGGTKSPNMTYADWVAAAGRHARKVIEQAAALHGQPVAEMTFISAGPS